MNIVMSIILITVLIVVLMKYREFYLEEKQKRLDEDKEFFERNRKDFLIDGGINEVEEFYENEVYLQGD